MDDIGAPLYGRVCARCVQTNKTTEHMSHQKCFLFRRRSGAERGRSAVWTDWHTSASTSSSASRDDRTNTVIMTRWVYTAHSSAAAAATIFSYSTISSLCSIISVFIIRFFCFFLGSCSHPFASTMSCHCVNSISQPVDVIIVILTTTRVIFEYMFWNCHTQWLMNFTSKKTLIANWCSRAVINKIITFFFSFSNLRIKFRKTKTIFISSFRQKLLQIEWRVSDWFLSPFLHHVLPCKFIQI